MNEEEIFQVAAEMPAAERGAYLATACEGQPALRQRIERLLASHDIGGFMQRPADRADSAELKAKLSRLKPEEGEDRIGNYKLFQKIGEGGFGTVWMAEQLEPVRRRVALKIIKLGMDTREVIVRFEQERQALALMDHPNIAKVLDAGATPLGRPFFVMELVQGIRITDFCDQNNLSTQERLDLFIAVCHAIQHAHQKGIIHRDIKPSNILVTLHDGVPVPKVIDFGVAKAIQSQRLTDLTFFTRFEQMIGTPLYMSPEQAEMSGLDIDTRTDIYSLGVLLYELLTGKTPFDAKDLMALGVEAMRKTIREREPVRPSTQLSQTLVAADVRRLKTPSADTPNSEEEVSASSRRLLQTKELIHRLRGDLDWIVMKCLEKDRTRRYETPSGLVADLRRHLSNEPVVARPPTPLYRFQKTVRRNKLIFAASGAVALTMLMALIVLAFSIARISREKDLRDLALREKGIALQEKDAALVDAQVSARAANDQLFLALLNQARASRFSGQMGQRLGSLEALTKAAHIRIDERLRDEAIAAMALPDIRLGRGWPLDRLTSADGYDQLTCVDESYRFSANIDTRGTITVRSVPNHQEIGRIESGHHAQVLRFSGDGRFLAQVDERTVLRVWRVADAQSILSDTPEMCSDVAFSLDGRQVVTGQEDRVLRFDLASGRETHRWQVQGRVHSLAFAPDNRQLAVGYKVAAVTSIYDSVEGRHLANLLVGSMEQQVVAWHPDGRRLAVSGTDPRIQIWDVSAKVRLATLEGHVQRVTSLSFHPAGELLASEGWEGVCRLWHPSSGRQQMQFPRSLSPFNFSKGGRWLGGVGYGESGQLVEVSACPEYRTIVSSLGVGRGKYEDGDISPNKGLLALAMQDGVRLWDLSNSRELAWLPIGQTISATFQPDGSELVTCGPAGLYRWSIQESSDTPTQLRIGPPSQIPLPFIPLRATRSRDGRTLAVVSEQEGGTLLVDLKTGSVAGPLMPHPSAGEVALSPDGQWLATAGWHSRRARLWNVASGRIVREWLGKSNVRLSFTPDSRTLILASTEEFTFWDVESFREVRPSVSCEVALYPMPVVYSPDGTLMAMITSPGTVHLKETTTARTVARLEDPHGHRTTWMKFAPDGAELVAVSTYAKEIHVWDLRAIRAQLKQMGLDWDWPEFPPIPYPVKPDRFTEPRLRIQVITAPTTPSRRPGD